jgi:sugar phosphate isomerase/epimerase
MKKSLRTAAIITMATSFAATALAVDFREHIGLQLYSLKDEFAKDPHAALDLVKSYGIVEVETAGTAGMTPEAYLAEIKKRGLQAKSAHVQFPAMTENIGAVIAELKALGVDTAFCPWIPHDGAFDAEELTKAIDSFNAWGKAMHEAGIRFGYHPHGYEFAPGSKSGETLFDEMVARTDSRYVNYEMDVFWVAHPGVDPVALLNKYPDRWLALHIKDLRKGAETGITTGHAPKTDVVAVGVGQIDWAAVIGTAQKLGIRYYYIEDETVDPLKNIPISIEYLKNLKVK